MNDSVRRLAYQATKAQKLVLQVPPAMPESMIKRFPELKAWSDELQEVARKNERVIRDYVTQATASSQSSP